MSFSLAGWFPYLGASLSGFEPDDTGSGVTNRQIVESFFLAWLVLWSIGLFVVLIAITGWFRRTLWILLGLTGVMLLISIVTYLMGASQNLRLQ